MSFQPINQNYLRTPNIVAHVGGERTPNIVAHVGGERTPNIVPERDKRYDRFIFMDERPRDMRDIFSTRDRYDPFIIMNERPRDMRDMFPIRDRIDLFLGGLAGSPSFEVFPPDIDSPGENAARERYRQQNPGPVRGRTWDQIQRDMSLIRARMGLKGV